MSLIILLFFETLSHFTKKVVYALHSHLIRTWYRALWMAGPMYCLNKLTQPVPVQYHQCSPNHSCECPIFPLTRLFAAVCSRPSDLAVGRLLFTVYGDPATCANRKDKELYSHHSRQNWSSSSYYLFF